jgi:hypothetical protein
MSLILVLFFKCQDSVASLFYSLCTLEHGEVCHRPNSLPSSFSSPSAYLKCETLEPVKKVKASKTLFSVQRGTWGGNYSSVIIVLFTIAAFEVVSEATLSKCRSFLSPTGRSGRCQTVAGYSCRCMLLPKLRF